MLIRKIHCLLAVCICYSSLEKLESKIQNPSWRKMGERNKRHQKSKKGGTGVNSSICICAWFVIFLKLSHSICLFAGYKLFPSQAFLQKSNIARSSPEIWQSLPRIRLSACSPGDQGGRNGMNWHLLGVALFMLCYPDVPFGVPVSFTAVTMWK